MPVGLLDAQALAALQELDPSGQAGLVQRVLATYTQSLDRLLEQIRAGRDSRDRAAMRHAAHTLKSSSASVGALDLSRLCAEVEAAVRSASADESGLARQVDALIGEGERVLQGLKQR